MIQEQVNQDDIWKSTKYLSRSLLLFQSSSSHLLPQCQTHDWSTMSQLPLWWWTEALRWSLRWTKEAQRSYTTRTLLLCCPTLHSSPKTHLMWSLLMTIDTLLIRSIIDRTPEQRTWQRMGLTQSALLCKQRLQQIKQWKSRLWADTRSNIKCSKRLQPCTNRRYQLVSACSCSNHLASLHMQTCRSRFQSTRWLYKQYLPRSWLQCTYGLQPW